MNEWRRPIDGSTIFLDEIGEHALDLQVKLLRVPPLRDRIEDIPSLVRWRNKGHRVHH